MYGRDATSTYTPCFRHWHLLVGEVGLITVWGEGGIFIGLVSPRLIHTLMRHCGIAAEFHVVTILHGV